MSEYKPFGRGLWLGPIQCESQRPLPGSRPTHIAHAHWTASHPFSSNRGRNFISSRSNAYGDVWGSLTPPPSARNVAIVTGHCQGLLTCLLRFLAVTIIFVEVLTTFVILFFTRSSGMASKNLTIQSSSPMMLTSHKLHRGVHSFRIGDSRGK